MHSTSRQERNPGPSELCSFGFANVRSLLDKTATGAFPTRLCEANLDIYGICESWLDDSIGNPALLRECLGYRLLRRDHKRSGGGVAAFVKTL